MILRHFYYSVQRECWENRWLYRAPLAAAGVFLIGFVITVLRKGPMMAGAMPYHMAAGLLMLTAMVAGAFYSVETLYRERRDRSILFWRSLPVSDAVAVIAKASLPMLLLPLFAFALTVVLQLAMLLVSSVLLSRSLPSLWSDLDFARMIALLLYHWTSVHILWEAPLYGWLLFISAWAPRAALVWAFLPPLAVGTIERLVFGTSHFASMLSRRLSGGGAEAITIPGTFPMDPRTHATVGPFLTSPGLWLGLALTAVFLTACISLRQRRGAAD